MRKRDIAQAHVELMGWSAELADAARAEQGEWAGVSTGGGAGELQTPVPQLRELAVSAEGANSHEGNQEPFRRKPIR